MTSEEQLLYFHLDPARGKKLHDNLLGLDKKMRAALARSRELREKLESFPVRDISDSKQKAWLLTQATEVTEDLRTIGDLLLGASLAAAGRSEEVLDEELLRLSSSLAHLLNAPSSERERRRNELRRRAEELLGTGGAEKHTIRRPFHWSVEFPEVSQYAGFDAFVGNPPFRGGKLISGVLGTDYREYLVSHVANDRKGTADLCAYFFLRAAALVREHGQMGLIATNTIAQGDTREVGLDALLANEFRIIRAIPSLPWPGGANLEVAELWLRRGGWHGGVFLSEREVTEITSSLSSRSRASGRPERLASNRQFAFQGSIVAGEGFILTPDEAASLLRERRNNREVVMPYLGGQDVNSDPKQQARRWIINFYDWPLHRDPSLKFCASDYPECLSHLERTVRVERRSMSKQIAKSPWWRFWCARIELYDALKEQEQVLVIVLHSKYLVVASCDAHQVFSHALAVFPRPWPGLFAVLQSSIHEAWVRRHGSTLETRLRYTITDCLETFPFPIAAAQLKDIGYAYDVARHEVMAKSAEGLTKTYNRFHDRAEDSAEIRRLRRLHLEADEALKCAYGWSDLRLDHGFQETPLGCRYTLSERAQVEVLDRLLELNRTRFAEESRTRLQPPGALARRPPKGAALSRQKPAPKKGVGDARQGGLFTDGEDE